MTETTSIPVPEVRPADLVHWCSDTLAVERVSHMGGRLYVTGVVTRTGDRTRLIYDPDENVVVTREARRE